MLDFLVLTKHIGLKPIFHQNAKYLVSGVGVGQCTRRQIFALANAKYTNRLVYFGVTPDANPKICVTPDASQGNIGGVGPGGVGPGGVGPGGVGPGGVGPGGVGPSGVGHVHFMFFVLISFAFCSQRKPSFQWNMGFKICYNL